MSGEPTPPGAARVGQRVTTLPIGFRVLTCFSEIHFDRLGPTVILGARHWHIVRNKVAVEDEQPGSRC